VKVLDSKLLGEIRDIFFINSGYATTKEISKRGINRYYINELKRNGFIEPIKRGLYKWVDYNFDFDFELAEVFKIVPKGILCLKSALSYHELTTFNPWQYEIAVERSSKVVISKYPPIKLLYFSKDLYELGITEVYVEGHKVRVYDVEKTICDCIRYRNSIGMDMVKEGLHEYLKRKNRDLNKLLLYAKKCRVEKIIREYLEVLV
jgi:predicted transcriptional regulator of viral defense system